MEALTKRLILSFGVCAGRADVRDDGMGAAGGGAVFLDSECGPIRSFRVATWSSRVVDISFSSMSASTTTDRQQTTTDTNNASQKTTMAKRQQTLTHTKHTHTRDDALVAVDAVTSVHCRSRLVLVHTARSGRHPHTTGGVFFGAAASVVQAACVTVHHEVDSS